MSERSENNAAAPYTTPQAGHTEAIKNPPPQQIIAGISTPDEFPIPLTKESHAKDSLLDDTLETNEAAILPSPEAVQSAQEPPSGTPPETTGKKKKKHCFFRTVVRSMLGLLLLLILAAGGFLLYAVADSASPPEHIPENYSIYAHIPSAGVFLKEVLALQTLDSTLSALQLEQLQGTLRSLRASPLLSASWFPFASNIRIDAALYSGGSYLAVAKLAVRSAPLRLLPHLVSFFPDALDSVKELRSESANGLQYWTYRVHDDLKLYIGLHKDLLLISPSPELFFSAYTKHRSNSVSALKEAVKKSGQGSIRILSHLNYIKTDFEKDTSPAASVIKALSFPEHTLINLNLKQETIGISGQCTWDSTDAGLKTILRTRSAIPGILNRLPKSTAYLTLLNMGNPDFLLENAASVLPKALMQTYTDASKSSQLVFKKDISHLLSAWIGDEMGVFGIEQTDSPVVFLSLKDEKLCRKTFEDVFSTIFLYKDVSALADGLRIPRIEFPDILKKILRTFGIDLPTPFYIIKDGYLYLSQSAETLAAIVHETAQNNFLVKTENWKGLIRTLSPESSLFVYYTLEEHIPAFLTRNTMLHTILKDYGKGVISLRLSEAQQLTFEIFSQKTRRQALGELSGFPYRHGTKITSDIYTGKNNANEPYSYWAAGSSVYALHLADKSLYSLKLDDKAALNIQYDRAGSSHTIEAVWIVSARGTVYKTDYRLRPFAGFPVLIGEKCSGEPQVLPNGVVTALANKANLCFIRNDGTVQYSDDMHTKLKQPPAVFGTSLAALPRSFDSMFYLFDIEGKIRHSIPLDSIAAVQPLLYLGDSGALYTAILTENGLLTLQPCSGEVLQNEHTYQLDLAASCKVPPAYDADAKLFYIITGNGYLHQINTKARIVNSLLLKQHTPHGGEQTVDSYRLTLLDLTGNGKQDIMVSGGGNAVYAYTQDLVPLNGFPVKGNGTARLIDADGDGTAELALRSIDNAIHLYTIHLQ